MATIVKDLGAVTAYAYAKEKGYTGTEGEFAELMASYADVAEQAADSAAQAVASATAAEQAKANAASSASAAASSASTASTKASEAASSASSAAGSANTATTKANEASTSATNAASSASAAATSATNAGASATAAASLSTAASNAQAAAETAQGKAEDAQTAAEDAAASVSESAAQITQNAEDIADLKSALKLSFDGVQTFDLFGNFQHYGLDSNGHFLETQKYRVSNDDPMQFDRDLLVSVSSGFRWGYGEFNNGTVIWSGWKTSDFVMPAGTTFVVQIARTTENTSEIANVQEFVSAVTFETNLGEQVYADAKKLKEIAPTIDDIKNVFDWEIGGLDTNGVNFDPQTWRLRTALSIAPFDITISKTNGYQFRITTFDNASMANPVTGSWQAANGATVELNAGTYFRLVALRTWHDTSEYAITDIALSNVFNNIFIHKTGSKSVVNQEKIDAIKSFNPCFVSMAHQGFSTTNQYYGNNRVSSYIGAFKRGFNAAETDVQFSSDDVPVCCHDTTFTDSVSGITVVIADHTAEELKTYNYYGEHIATLDEIMSVCKTRGLRLELDKISLNWSTNNWQSVFDIVSKYQMQNHIIWTLPYNDNEMLNKVLSYDKHATILIGIQDKTLVENMTSWCRTVMSKFAADCTFIIAILYTALTVDELIAFNKNIPERNINILVFTIDDANIYQSYMPYAWGITSNKICANDIMFA